MKKKTQKALDKCSLFSAQGSDREEISFDPKDKVFTQSYGRAEDELSVMSNDSAYSGKSYRPVAILMPIVLGKGSTRDLLAGD